MTDERINCPKCNKKSVPRLWHRGSFFSKKKTDHICPFCGSTMYTTGGGASILSILLITMFLLFSVNALLSSFIPKTEQQAIPTKRYQISDELFARAKKRVQSSNIEIQALQEKINKNSTAYLLERRQMYEERKLKYQKIIDQYYQERND